MNKRSSLFFMIFMIFSSHSLPAQTITRERNESISNVQARQEGLEIIITYDMAFKLQIGEEIKVSYYPIGSYRLHAYNAGLISEGELFDLTDAEWDEVIRNKEQVNQFITIPHAEGDVGKNVKPGANREIFFLNDDFIGKNVVFKVFVLRW